MTFPRAEGGSFVVAPDFWLTVSAIVLVITPIVALSAGLVSRRRSRKAGAPSTAWATGALFVVRVVLAFTLVGTLAALLVHGRGTGVDVRTGDTVITHRDGGLSVPVADHRTVQLCDTVPVRRAGKTVFEEANCQLARQLAADVAAPQASLNGFLFTLTVPHPTAAERHRFTALLLMSQLLLVLGAFSLERILRRTARREPFARQNVRWLRVLAILVAFYGLVYPSLVHRFSDALIRAHAPLQDGRTNLDRLDAGHSAALGSLAVAILILVLAEIWRFGIRLQEDVEATV